jgi:hypothetical protein
MDLRPYVENIQAELIVAAEAGGEEARALADRLLPTLDAAIRLTLQDVLVSAVEEITCELAPGSVELRLRGRETEFVVTPPPAEGSGSADLPPTGPAEPPAPSGEAPEADDGSVARINLRMPDQLKGRVERAAAGEGLSVNSWLVRAATAALQRGDTGPADSRPSWGGQRYTGWAR